MHVLECVKCGNRFAPEHEKQWGRTKNTNGYGPRPKCTAIVPDEYAPKLRGEAPGQVCGGSLVVADISAMQLAEDEESGRMQRDEAIPLSQGRRR